jgi:predicted dehydrogenase/nucleoside-diphosphate-sugar epimerase
VTDAAPSIARSASPTRVAVVGAGFIADFHLAILAGTDGVELVAVCDPVQHRAEALARRFGVPNAVGSTAELAELGVQVAHVLVPPHLHVTVAGELLEAGIGVLLEKPLALDSADARALGALASERGLPLGCNHNALHFPSFARLMERVRAGEVGKVEHVQVTLSVPLRQLDAGDVSHWMFAAPRNIVFEQAVHPLSQALHLVGPVVESNTTVLSSRELSPGQVFHDRWLLAASGERATLELYLAFGQGFTRSTIQVIGSDGSIEADLFHDHVAAERKTMWLDFWNSFLAGWRRGTGYRRSAARVLKDYGLATLGLVKRRDGFYVGMQGSIRAFHAALRAGQGPPVDAEEAAQVLEWCEAITEGVPGAPEAAEPLPEGGEPRPGEVVVVGGTGFIGRRTVARLLELGLPVTALVRRTHGLPEVIQEGARDGRIRLVRGSLEDPASLATAVRGARVVMQLATGGGSTWEDFQRGMIDGSLALAEAAANEGVERYVFVSSTAALYLGRDTDAELADDNAPDPDPAKRALYARGKIETELALRALAERRKLPLVITRPGIVLGPGTPLQHSGIGLWARDNHCVGWGAGRHPLPLVLADDVADALARAAAWQGHELDGASLNLCARVPLNSRELIDAMRERTGRDMHFHPRSLELSQVMEVGKWIVKQVGGRRDAPFPAWRDLKSREMYPRFRANVSRDVLGWQPVEGPDEFLDRAYGPRPGAGEPSAPATPGDGAVPAAALPGEKLEGAV